MKLKKMIAAWLALVLVLSCFGWISAGAADGITLYIDNQAIQLKNPCVLEDDVVYVPLEEVFFKLGIYMSWDERNGYWFGEGNNGEIRLTPGEIKADIDWVDVEMPAPVKNINGVAMMPAFIIEDAAKTSAPVYDAATQSLYVEFPDITENPEREFQIASVVPYLPEGDELFGPEDLLTLKDSSLGSTRDKIVCTNVEVEGMHFDKAVQLETLYMETVPNADYSVQWNIAVNGGDFMAGDVGLLSFWARATKITDESGMARFKPVYEQMDKWNKAAETRVDVSTEWKQYYIPLYSGLHSLYSGKSSLNFVVGYKAQIIQIADMHLVNYHDQISLETLKPGAGGAYKGMEEDALWRKEAYKRIEKYRKNDMLIQVVDEEGNPVEGAAVKADMTENEFMFGIALVYYEVCEQDWENSRVSKIRSDVMSQFNTGISGNEMKTDQFGTDYRWGARVINEYLSRGMRTRGHALMWNDQKVREHPEYADQKFRPEDEEDMTKLLLDEVAAEAWMFRGVISEWDGLNEPHDSNHWRYAFGTEAYSKGFQIAKAIDPKARLIVNETGMEGHENRDEGMRAPGLRAIVDKMVDEERAPIDGLGVQGHCTRYLYPQGFYRELDALVGDRYDTVSVTEYDFYNEDYTYAPQHLRDTLVATISHPKANCFVVWGFQDTMHWRDYGPFYDKQFHEKPEYAEWKRLMNEEFATHETAVTDAEGNALIRGFRGKYEITVEANGVKGKTEFTLTNSEDTERDNKITVILKNGKAEISHANPWEVYAENNSETGRVEFETLTAAMADYKEYTANRELIGVYKHTDQDGNSLPRATDGLYNSFHYLEDGGYAQYELVKKADQGTVLVDFRAPMGEVYNYKVYTSADGEEYKEIYAGSSADKTEIPFTDTMFIKIESDGNEYMGISEVTIHAEKKKN